MAKSSKDSGYVDNWQTGKTVTECNLHMLTTEDCSDVIFRVGSEKHVARAHRYVLVSRSCVFHAMFCGPLAEKGEVTIPDVEPAIFREFLRYVYTDTADINAENVTGLLYTSRKYAVDGLLNQCSTFLEKSLTEENVCQILEQCHGYGEVDLEQKALEILTKAGEKVIKSQGFLDLCSNCLSTFLKSNRLNVKEEDIFHAVLSWTKAKCAEENISPTPENLRKHLGDKIYEIRFPEFSLDFLVKVVGPSGILTDSERVRIIDRTVHPAADISPFKSVPRQISAVMRNEEHLPDKLVNRFRHISICNLSWWSYETGNQDAISFSVNKNIHLVGCQLYGPAYRTESTYRMNILLYDDQDQLIAEPVPTSDRKLSGQRVLSDVIFPDAISLVAARTYTICVYMKGEGCNYGKEGRSSVTTDGVKFTFKKATMKKAIRSSTDYGQIPGLIWRYANHKVFVS